MNVSCKWTHQLKHPDKHLVTKKWNSFLLIHEYFLISCIYLHVWYVVIVCQVIDFDRQLIGDDRVQISVESSMEPLPMSPYGEEDFGFQIIKNSIRQVWTEAVVAPGR